MAAAEVPARVDALLDAGIRQFVDLTEEGERPAPYAATLRERADARGLRAGHRRFAIRDFGVPSAALMRATLDAIYGAMAAGEPRLCALLGRHRPDRHCRRLPAARAGSRPRTRRSRVIARKWRVDGEARPAPDVARVARAVRVHPMLDGIICRSLKKEIQTQMSVELTDLSSHLMLLSI